MLASYPPRPAAAAEIRPLHRPFRPCPRIRCGIVEWISYGFRARFMLNGSLKSEVFELSSTESRFSQIRGAFGFAILLIRLRLNGEWRGQWSLWRNRVKRVLLIMSMP